MRKWHLTIFIFAIKGIFNKENFAVKCSNCKFVAITNNDNYLINIQNYGNNY